MTANAEPEPGGERIKRSEMNPTSEDLAKIIASNRLAEALRGEVCIFFTSAEINGSLRPTDHDQLLEKGIYPLIAQFGKEFLEQELEKTLVAICHDALGVFCAHQCYYLETLREEQNLSPLPIDRTTLPRILAQNFIKETPALHRLEIRKGDVALDASYRVMRSQMRILQTDCGVDWGINLTSL